MASGLEFAWKIASPALETRLLSELKKRDRNFFPEHMQQFNNFE